MKTLAEIHEEYPKGIIVKCYGTAQVFKSRRSASNYYQKACRYSEGSERDRYLTILDKLSYNWDVVSDNEDIYELKDEMNYAVKEVIVMK